MKRLVIVGGAVLVLVAIIAVESRLTVSALPEPGRMETFLANKTVRYLVQRSSNNGVPAPPSDQHAAAKQGEILFGTECAACHGVNGRNRTDAGRWMYPRAANLTLPEAQSYSDKEVFWIIKNGIRWSGMPAFGRVEPDEHIWDLVFYIRTLPKSSATERSTREPAGGDNTEVNQKGWRTKLPRWLCMNEPPQC